MELLQDVARVVAPQQITPKLKRRDPRVIRELPARIDGVGAASGRNCSLARRVDAPTALSTVASRRADAIFMILKFGNGRKSRRVADLGDDENIKAHVLQSQR